MSTAGDLGEPLALWRVRQAAGKLAQLEEQERQARRELALACQAALREHPKTEVAEAAGRSSQAVYQALQAFGLPTPRSRSRRL